MMLGRKPLPEHLKKSHMLHIPVTPGMWEEFQKLGLRLRMPATMAARNLLEDGLKRVTLNGG